jgi:phosphoketolase
LNVSHPASNAADVTQYFRDKLIEHRNYFDEREEMPEIQNWSWAYETPARADD